MMLWKLEATYREEARRTPSDSTEYWGLTEDHQSYTRAVGFLSWLAATRSVLSATEEGP